MARPLFSDMLLNRRRQLGLTIKQASNVLRLKEEVLIAFEEGDFDSIPKSGYAQGMLASYARYLGLNAKTVVNQFSADLFEHERGSGSHEARLRNRQNRDADDGPLYEVPQAAAPRSRRTYVESRGFLPTAGGFAGDMGDFATTSAARPRYSSSSHETSDDSYDAYPQGRPYTSRVPYSQGAVSPLGYSQRQRPTTRRTASSIPGNFDMPASSSYGRDEVTMRRVTPAQYRDDMRLDNAGTSYESASSSAGRRSSRNIASTERPIVRRRQRSSREQLRSRERAQASNGGLVGMVSEFLQDRTRVLVLVIALLCLVITLTLIFSVRSCVNGGQSNSHTVPVTPSEQSSETDEKEEGTITDEEEERARADAAAAKAAETETTDTERTFEVTVADGEVTWIEIEYDGSSDIAETVTGPWNRTYTVRQSISINVNDTTAVTVTEGGKKLEFDTKASGIGTITIQVSKKSPEVGVATDGDQAQQGDGQTQQTDGQTQGQTQTGTDAALTTQQTDTTVQTQTTYDDTKQQATPGANGGFEGYTLDSDGYYYGEDGYYDAAGNFYSY